jgi:HSP20 family molecular chaperone IbpA
MWAQACDVIDRAERMHRQFFRLTAPGRARVTWEPPVDIFEDELELVILVALPGVPAQRIEVTTEAGELVVRAERGLPFGAASGALRRLEIPYGYFERRIRLPDARLEMRTHELVDGCLILHLRKIAPGEMP